jgi:hypothetical protein
MKNSDKYGDKKDDIISQAFNDRYEYGVGFVKYNILKYLERHKRVSQMPLLKRCYYLMLGKGGKSDIDKAKDYRLRWWQQAMARFQDLGYDETLGEYEKFINSQDVI